ncbi:MAG TPA: response regulator [Methylocella sp.]|nr:response regulator [Methylocella sp.]
MDDDSAVLSSLQFLLELEGFDVVTFTSGEELLSQPVLPDRGCFVIDYSMPFMNGLEVLARLRARRSMLPVIFITGRSDGSIERRALQAGALKVLRKPHINESLIGAIGEAFSAYSPPGEHRG